MRARQYRRVTFTEKASSEIKERIYERVQEALGSVIGLPDIYVGTIHSPGFEVLRTEALLEMKYGDSKRAKNDQ